MTFTAPLTLSHFPPAKASGGELGHGVGAYLDLFQRELVSCIVGSRSAWRRLVLQAVFEEPALGHAAVAFSALQKATAASPSDEGIKRFELVSPSLSSDEVRLALRHYERCIQEMQRVVGSGSRDSRCVNIVLLCTVICIGFELCMHEPLVALSHLEHGLNIASSNHSYGTHPRIHSTSSVD